ncbi:hypothetical protein [Methylobacterium marchantiae]|uniref:Uncharacterized protein n=1 Tax=Methylobacterium marchantiae TaxID=600331 RepID=A0ABW3WUL5_9HYPH
MIQREADLRSPPISVSKTSFATAYISQQPAISAATTVREATARSTERKSPAVSEDQNTVLNEKPALKPRRTMRDGCEGAISSLAGPEARRMIPGRCIA